MTAECLSHLSACAIRRLKARMAAKRFIKERITHKLNLFEFPLSLGSVERPRPLPIHNHRGEFIHLFGALFSSSDSMNEILSFVVRKNSFFAFLHGRVTFLASSSFRFSFFFVEISCFCWFLVSIKHSESCEWSGRPSRRKKHPRESPFEWSSSVALSSFDTRDVKGNINHLELNWDSDGCLHVLWIQLRFSVIYHHFDDVGCVLFKQMIFFRSGGCLSVMSG